MLEVFGNGWRGWHLGLTGEPERDDWIMKSFMICTHHHSGDQILVGETGYPCGLYQVKVTLVQALRLCTGRTAHRGSRGIALHFLDHGTRRGWGVSVTPRPFFTPGKDPVPIVQEAGWAPGPVWTGAENLAPTGIRSPDRPARSQSLYRLRYPAHMWHIWRGRKIHRVLIGKPEVKRPLGKPYCRWRNIVKWFSKN